MATKTVTETCTDCYGSGKKRAYDSDGGEFGMDGCHWCGGSGNTLTPKWFKKGSGKRRVVLKESTCHSCEGLGKEITVHSFLGNSKYGKCHSCNGSGKTWIHDHYVD